MDPQVGTGGIVCVYWLPKFVTYLIIKMARKYGHLRAVCPANGQIDV